MKNKNDTANVINSMPTAANELLGRIKSLENKVSELQKICDERMDVINSLNNAASPPLNAIKSWTKKPLNVIKKIFKL